MPIVKLNEVIEKIKKDELEKLSVGFKQKEQEERDDNINTKGFFDIPKQSLKEIDR